MTNSSAIASRRLRTAARCALSLVALAAAIFHGSSASALTFDWAKLGSGNFNDPNNWDVNNFPDTVSPGLNDFVTFGVGLSSYTVTFPGNELVNDGGFGGVAITSIPSYKSRNLRVRDSGVVFSGSTQPLRGALTYTITNPSETEADRGIIIGVAAGENAKLSLSHAGVGGGLTALSGAAATLGDAAGSTGTLNVGFGAFNVTGSDASTFSTPLSQLTVGNHGTGNLNVTGGADVNVLGHNSRTAIGHKAGGVGNVKISGAGSTWTSANELWVGSFGTGALTVQSGGSLVTNGAGGTDATVLGVFKGSRGSVTLTGAGSTWTNSTKLSVGAAGNGELTIANGARLINTNTIGAITTVGGNAFGIATVTGPGSTWVAPDAIHIQGAGQGALHIRNGGSVTAGRILMKGVENGTGEIFVSDAGSTLNVTTGPLVVGKAESSFDVGRSSLVINPGARVNVTHDVDLQRNGVLKLQGGTLAAASIGSSAVQIQGTFEWTSGTLHAGVVHSTSVINQAGKLAPGLPIGSTMIDGNYTQLAAASMEIEIGGTVATTQHDFVLLEGSASLNGALQFALVNSFMPTPDQTFTILESLGGITGAFSNVANGQRLATVALGGTFQVNYGAGSAFEPNRIVLSNFEIDANLDFLERQRRFGQAPSRAAAIGGVPEPSTAILGCLAALGLAAVSRSGRAVRRALR